MSNKLFPLALAFCIKVLIGFAPIQQAYGLTLTEQLAHELSGLYRVKLTGEEQAVVEKKVISLLEQGADPDEYIYAHRSTPLGLTIFPVLLDPMFFIVADYSDNLEIPHYQKTISPLDAAFKSRSFQGLKYLKERGAKINVFPVCCGRNEVVESLLYRAVRNADIEMAEFLVDLGVNLDVGRGDVSPLRLSIQKENYELALWLIDKGAMSDGQAILHDAIYRGAPISFVKKLIEIGYGPWSVDSRGISALELAKQQNLTLYKYLKTFN